MDFDASLADNGGPTQTHALFLGSVAIDAAGACGLVTDQRGVPRDDGACDSGSFELSTGLSDQDGDGIEDLVDGTFDGGFTDESAVFSNNFTDQHLGGTSFGRIVDRGGLVVTVLEEVNPRGLRISTAPGPSGTARIAACGSIGEIKLDAGREIVVDCGSLTVEVVVGPVEIELGQGTILTIPTGGIVALTELGNHQVEVRNDSPPGTPPILLDVNGEITELDPGETVVVTVEPPAVPTSSPLALLALGGGLLVVLALALRPRRRWARTT